MSLQFTMGATATAGVMLAIQDWYGMDGYIQHVRDHWVDLPWWVGAAIAGLSVWIGRDKVPPRMTGEGCDKCESAYPSGQHAITHRKHEHE